MENNLSGRDKTGLVVMSKLVCECVCMCVLIPLCVYPSNWFGRNWGRKLFGIVTVPDLCTVYVSYFSFEAAFAHFQVMSLFISRSAGHSFEKLSMGSFF